jgi:phosphoglycerate dehydrogenase-like enzyme
MTVRHGAPCGLDEALRAADVISLHAPLTPETEDLISEAALRLVKPGAVLINCGRGGLLDLHAAYAALLDGRSLASASTSSTLNRPRITRSSITRASC